MLTSGRRRFLNSLLGTGFVSTLAAMAYPVWRFLIPPAAAEPATQSVVAALASQLKPNSGLLFKFGSKFLDTRMGAINTAVLILSSLTMAWGVTAAQQNKQGLLKLMLTLTLCGAAGFLVIKYFEYTHKFHEGWYPGLKFYMEPSEHSHTFKRPGAHGSAGDGHSAAGEGAHSAESPGSASASEAGATTAARPRRQRPKCRQRRGRAPVIREAWTAPSTWTGALIAKSADSCAL